MSGLLDRRDLGVRDGGIAGYGPMRGQMRQQVGDEDKGPCNKDPQRNIALGCAGCGDRFISVLYYCKRSDCHSEQHNVGDKEGPKI